MFDNETGNTPDLELKYAAYESAVKSHRAEI
jgi:hypothetical protein